MDRAEQDRGVREIRRPHPRLLVYYAISSLVLGPLFPVLLIPRLLRYRTLRYDFGEEGISLRWGLLFRREIHLTYVRIQDIHLHSNVLERWLGLGRVLIETASGSSRAEMTLEGVLEFEALRDFIYGRMSGPGDEARRATAAAQEARGTEEPQELVAVLQDVADELRQIRRLLARDTTPGG